MAAHTQIWTCVRADVVINTLLLVQLWMMLPERPLPKLNSRKILGYHIRRSDCRSNSKSHLQGCNTMVLKCVWPIANRPMNASGDLNFKFLAEFDNCGYDISIKS